MRPDLKQIERTGARWFMLASSILALVSFATPAMCEEVAPLSMNPAAQSAAASQPLPGENNQGGYADPLSGFNEPMFTFNLKLDDWVLRPVASGYSDIAPTPVRQSVGRFFDNVRVIPRFANNLFQLKLAEAGTEVARFGINTTVGVAGLFDPADEWFGLKEHPNDFGLYHSLLQSPGRSVRDAAVLWTFDGRRYRRPGRGRRDGPHQLLRSMVRLDRGGQRAGRD
jgi:hypothetical protein